MTRWSLMNEATDKIVVAHCWSAKKNEYLPIDQKNDFIRDKVDTECIALGDRWVFDSMEMVDGGKAAKELLNDAAQRNKAHVCVVGYHGRKGPKKDPTVMGTAVQYMGLHATVPVFILKDPIKRKDKKNEAFRFAACCDGSEQSLRALIYIAKMKRKQDSVQVITCEQANLDANVVKATAETVLEDLGANENLEFNVLPSETGRRTADIVREFVVEKSEYIDFLFCGNRGADFSSKDKNSYLGSVSNEIVRTTKLNLFFMV